MTYSIVARDPESGQIGVAVQSRVPACAATVLHADAGVGAVATQSFALRAYGPRLLHRLRAGEAPDAALAELVAADEQEAVRQVGVIDAQGRVAVHTGSHCIPEAGHHIGEGYAAQANMMGRSTVWDAMGEAFEGATGELAVRLVAALQAAQDEGGDVRGQQAGGLLVVGPEVDELPYTSLVHDLRVDEHPAPVNELRRLLDVRRAFALGNQAQERAKAGDGAGAVELYERALALCDDGQLRWYFALALAAGGETEAAHAQLAQLGPEREAFVETARRLNEQDMGLPPGTVERLLS